MRRFGEIVWVREECVDPRLRYSKIMKTAWVLMREKLVPFREAMRESWRIAEEQCRKSGIIIRG